MHAHKCTHLLANWLLSMLTVKILEQFYRVVVQMSYLFGAALPCLLPHDVSRDRSAAAGCVGFKSLNWPEMGGNNSSKGFDLQKYIQRIVFFDLASSKSPSVS